MRSWGDLLPSGPFSEVMFWAGIKPGPHGFVCESETGRELIPTLERIAGIIDNEATIECPHCKVAQKIYIGRTAGKNQRQYVSCINCRSEFDVSVADKIVCGPFIA
jgi:hypothetical protein